MIVWISFNVSHTVYSFRLWSVLMCFCVFFFVYVLLSGGKIMSTKQMVGGAGRIWALALYIYSFSKDLGYEHK